MTTNHYDTELYGKLGLMVMVVNNKSIYLTNFKEPQVKTSQR